MRRYFSRSINVRKISADGEAQYDGARGFGGAAGTRRTGKIIADYGAEVNVIIGAGGTGATAGYPGGDGAPGYARLTWDGKSAIFNDAEVFREVAGHVPDKIAQANTRRCGVDLESLAIGKPRFYVDGDETGTLLLEFSYLATGALAVWKSYRRDPNDKHRVLIDRYGSDDRLFSVGEVERAGGPELWKGPAELPKIAIAAEMHAIFLAKEANEQSYLRLLPS